MGNTTSAPPGTVLNEAPVWFDNTVTVTSTGGALVTNGPVTYNGVVTYNSAVNNGSIASNDSVSAIAPSSLGLKAYNYPYVWATGTGSAVTTAGALYLAKIPIVGNTLVTDIYIKIATAASGLTSGQNFVGLYNSSGTRVATSADLTATIGTNTGVITCAMATPYTTPSSDYYYVGMFFNAGTTQPVLSAYTGFVTVTTSVATFGSATTFGNTAAKFPFSVSATGSNTTALPASITMASNTATGAYTLWVGVN
jgi:hypothetical protein